MSKEKQDDLEQLDVIESSALGVGNAFHAFRFKRTAFDLLSDQTRAVLEQAKDKLIAEHKISEDDAIELIEQTAEMDKRLEATATRILRVKSDT